MFLIALEIIKEKIIDELSHYDLVAVFTRLDETSIIVKKRTITDYFKRLGIELIDLRFEGINTTPEYRERLFTQKQEKHRQTRFCV